MRALPILALLLAACGQSGPENGISENQIDRVSRPKEVPDPRPASVRLEPLLMADIGLAACLFSRDGETVLAVTAADAAARIEGRLLHLAHSSPVGPTGGFFEDRQISISIGRLSETRGPTGAWPARATITNRRTQAQGELDGLWICAEANEGRA